MTKSALIWDENGRLFEGKEIEKVLSLPKGLFLIVIE
jgi:hypothetical protein